MRTNYFTKVENKFVFNLSLIFWHIFIALSTLTIIICLVVFLWSIVPSSPREVEKQSYPAKKQYPAPVKVALNELELEVVKIEEAPPVASEPEQLTSTAPITQVPEDTKGIIEYQNSLNSLKTLIPPSKYTWAGSGYWTYPQGERYWTFYKQEKYRQWVTTESGIDDKLKSSYKIAKANNYTEKKQMLDGYISILKLLPEEKRSSVLQDLLGNVADNIPHNIKIYQSLTKVVSIMSNEKNTTYVAALVRFGKNNPNDGSAFIDYTATIISKFAIPQQVNIIDRLTNSYYNYFNQNIDKQKEATDLFIPLVAQIKSELQSKAIMRYYGLYLNKNFDRDNSITQIENEYKQAMNEIDIQYNTEQLQAQLEYNAKKESKEVFRNKSLLGIAGGVCVVVIISTLLVFLSIQRSVRKIEEKISVQN